MIVLRRNHLVVIIVVTLLLSLAAQAQAQGQTHIVAPGETLFRIALRYGTTVEALATANNIADPTRIFVGQVLTIPGAVAVQVQPPPPTNSGPVHGSAR